MILKHFTNWDLSSVQIGDSFTTNSWVESKYWKQKKENTELISSNSLFNELEKILQQLNLSNQIDFSLLAQEVDKSKYYSELLKEFVFEEIRLMEFPEKPSRRKCMFLLPQNIDIVEYGVSMSFDMSTKRHLHIEICEPTSLHFADITQLNCNSLTHDEKVDFARKYWEGTNKRNMFTEILYEGEFRIHSIDN